MVASAGNGASYASTFPSGVSGVGDTYRIYPADWDEVISVTATTSADTRASYSDYNDYKNIAAPGTSIYSTYKGSDTDWYVLSGTSMASPVVAGIAALLFASRPGITPSQVEESLYSTAGDLGEVVGWDKYFGFGLVDANAALEYAQTLTITEPDGGGDGGTGDGGGTGDEGTGGGDGGTGDDGNGGGDSTGGDGTGDDGTGGGDNGAGGDNSGEGGSDDDSTGDNDDGAGENDDDYIDDGSDDDSNFEDDDGYQEEQVFIPTSINSTKVSAVKNVVYSGKSFTPKPVVKFGKTTLKLNRDYKLSYTNNKNIGTASVAITGIGNYQGTKTVKFSIAPATIDITKLTVGKKKLAVSWKKASAAQQITKYQVRYRVKGTSQWTTKTIAPVKSSYTITKLKSKKTYQIQVRSYKTVSGKKYYSNWSPTKTSKKIK
jgi:hypothetical protein